MKWIRTLMCSALAAGLILPVVAHAQTRLQEAAPAAIVYTGDWTHGDTTLAWSGGTASFSWLAPARATLIFSGTGVSWIGFRGSQTGIARVYVDGVAEADVDTFSPMEELQAVLFTRRGLASGAHTLIIEVTGTRNPQSSDPLIVVDAFDLEGTPEGRVEETGPAPISYTGTWTRGNTERDFGGRTAAVSAAPAARASLSFNGTAVSWIGFRGPQSGIARVFIDGVQQADVDAYAAVEEVQAVLFARSGLASGAHTLAIEVTGARNPASTDAFIVVDAFDVTP
jgi:hypothetical protein